MGSDLKGRQEELRKYEENDFEIMPRLLYEFSLIILTSFQMEINICWSAVAGGSREDRYLLRETREALRGQNESRETPGRGDGLGQ